MLKTYLLLLIGHFLLSCSAHAQDTLRTDTSKKLNEVTVRGYFSERPLLSTPASVGILNAQQLRLQPDNSFVSAMNTIPGVRMEERSPGSYRLSIRGSLLRSPFGVRDVKIYFAEIPLTDAGGNTYLNAIDMNSVQGVEVLKGPDGSLFGANSGGVVLLSPVNKYDHDNFISAGLNGGSYGLVHEHAAAQSSQGNYLFNFNQAYESYGGYRANSSMTRQYVQLVNRLTYGQANQLKVLGFYANLNYHTPGGLTLAQMEANPQSARLATPTIGSAQALNASIANKMLFGGIVNEVHLNNNLRNVLTIFGTNTDFTNPSYTVYEERGEATYGLRTYFELSGESHKTITWKADLGFEWQQTNSTIGDYGNRLGNKDTTQTRDQIRTNQNFLFGRFAATLNQRWELEAALSLNNYQYQFENLYPLSQTAFINRPFTAQLMPRLALAYSINADFVWRASVSRGYSTPTTAEVHATDHIINPNLQAQDGWNYETGFRIGNHNESLSLDASVFYYRLNNAIVMRMHPDGTSYYVNAGGTDQPGLELYFSDWLIASKKNGFIRGLQLTESLTYSKFTFRDYQNATVSYNGNNLTGVPGQVAVTGINVLLPQKLYLFIQHNFTAKLPLNDANTAYTDSYNLITAKAGWKYKLGPKAYLELFAGVDNLLNEHYSLGDDLNAAANRYYNPAALFNYFAGINMRL
jgi:iron complex outermembrane receptor protein